jgi:hypothetical protein
MVKQQNSIIRGKKSKDIADKSPSKIRGEANECDTRKTKRTRVIATGEKPSSMSTRGDS